MHEPLKTAAPDNLAGPGPDDELPPGDHALEVAARNGFGPLSPAAKRVWHGDAVPCVTCGQLVHREDVHCDHCGQDLSEEMVEKMRAHSGPWYVLEHLRPFPGVALDRIVRQIRRGLITETSIVRGPSTDYQWRFAVETPGLCRYFGRCWHCHHEVGPADSYCQGCLSHLSFEKIRPISEPRPPAPGRESERGAEATRPASARVPLAAGPPVGNSPPQRSAAPVPEPGSELARLANVVNRLETIPDANSDVPPRIGTIAATWIAVAILILAIIGVVWMANLRSPSAPPSAPTTTGLVSPASP